MSLFENNTNPWIYLESIDKTPEDNWYMISLDRFDFLDLGISDSTLDPDVLWDEGSTGVVSGFRSVVVSVATESDTYPIPNSDSEDPDSLDKAFKNVSNGVLTPCGVVPRFATNLGRLYTKNWVSSFDQPPASIFAWDEDTDDVDLDHGNVQQFWGQNCIYVRPYDGQTSVTSATAGDEGGSFNLELKILPSLVTQEGKKTAYPWSVFITSGNWLIQIEEGNSKLLVKHTGTKYESRLSCPLTKDATGATYANLIFMPVWNGLLIYTYGGDSHQDKEMVEVGYALMDPEINLESTIAELLGVSPSDGELLHGETTIERNFPEDDIVILENAATVLEPPEVLFSFCGGTLQYRPVYFAPKGVIADCMSPLEAAITKKLVPIVCKNGGGWEISTKEITDEVNTNHLLKWVKGDGSDMLEEGMEFRERLPLQIIGYLTYRSMDPESRDMSRQTGALTISSPRMKDIKSINVSRTLDGTSGQLQIDNYRTGDTETVHVGALQITLSGGKNTIPGQVLDGILWGVGPQIDTSNPKTYNFELKGLYQKTEDMRLVDIPPFDGYALKNVVGYLSSFAGIESDLTDTDADFRLRASLDIKAAAVYFKSGTSVKEALDTLAAQSGHIWFIDREGVLRFLPTRSTPYDAQTWEYAPHEVYNMQFGVELSHIANHVYVVGVVGGKGIKDERNKGNFESIAGDLQAIRLPITTVPVFPWSRVVVEGVPGIFTQDEFDAYAAAVGSRTQHFFYKGSMSVPGNAEMELLDTVTVGNTSYVVVAVSHRCDTQTKKWETTIEVEGKN